MAFLGRCLLGGGLIVFVFTLDSRSLQHVDNLVQETQVLTTCSRGTSIAVVMASLYMYVV